MTIKTTCFSVLFAKLDDVTHTGNELPLIDAERAPEIPQRTTQYVEYLMLNTVSNLKVTSNPVYDEGDSRIIYKEYTVEMSGILHNDMEFGNLFDGLGLTFDQKIEKIQNFLETQGLAINFIDYPSPIRRLIPSGESKAAVYQEYFGHSGWLIDSHNGPKPLSFEIESVVGDQAVMFSYQVKYRTAQSEQEASLEPLRPKISSELRIDIDDEGDIGFIVSGTIYADSLKAIYAARDWLDIIYQPDTVSNISPHHITTYQANKWSMVNGFLKEVSFNVDKTGRSAKFTIKYKQVKSNNAYPLGIRDIEFDQDIESSLLGDNSSVGGFTGWKNSFKAKVSVPPRMSQFYCWYVVHLLISQQLRKVENVFDKKTEDNPDEAETKLDVLDEKFVPKAYPLRFKIKNKHFKRELQFEVEYLLLCPLSKIINVSCILSRINNDYSRKLNNPNTPYVPISLSHQWHSWNRSTDPQQGFDPTQPNAQNLGTPGRPHRDTAGTEINDTGHNYDPVLSLDQQAKQKHILITTVKDPNELDGAYETNDETDPATTDDIETSIPSAPRGGNYDDKTLNSFSSGNTVTNPLTPANTTRAPHGISEDVSWIVYRQSYEIIETNPTIPTESLAAVNSSTFSDRVAAPLAPSALASAALGPYYPIHPSVIKKEKGFKLHGRVRDRHPDDPLVTNTSDPAYNANLDVATRRTYATKPSRYYIKVTGYAMRVGYKIPIPTVLSIAGQKAIRVGDGRSKHSNNGADADVPVYIAMWEQVYTIDRTAVSEDILSNIEDLGASALYL